MTAIDIPFSDEFETCEPPASDAQLSYVSDLRAQFDEARQGWCEATGTAYNPTKWGPLPATRSAASAAIDAGREAVSKMRRERQAARVAAQARTTPDESAEGMWIIGTVGDPAAEIFKIQRAVHGSGKLYAKELTDGRFEFAPGAITRVVREGRRMTLDEAKAFGKLYGVCCRCAATLTDENSIAAGIGPICAEKF